MRRKRRGRTKRPEPRSDETTTLKRWPTGPTRRHLHLVLDDWSLGYTIRKIDLSADTDPNYPGYGKLEGPFSFFGKQCLPPAIIRLEAVRGLPMYLAAVSDFSIMAMQPISPLMEGTLPSAFKGFFPMVDVVSLYTTFVPRPTTDLVDPIYITFGDKLFTLAAGSFEMLYYHQLLDSVRCFWQTLAEPPFKREHVTSYTSHPDGRIFVSVKMPAQDAATYTFHMAEDEPNGEWKQQYQFMLPFAGKAHFDPRLDAFVGFSRDPATIGHLCVVKVPPTNCPLGALKFGKENLFSGDNHGEKQIGATLVYLGGRSYYCLVQCIADEMDGDSTDDEMDGDSTDDEMDDKKHVSQFSHYSFRLTTFFLEYDKNGDVRIGGRWVRYYSVPEDVTDSALKNPVAFPM